MVTSSDRLDAMTSTSHDLAEPDTTMPAFVPSSDAVGQIELAEVRLPEPGPDQLVLAVEAYSVNRGETYLLKEPRPGWRPGQDVAGRVVRAAAAGGVREGTRVVGHALDGGWAPLVAVPTDAVAALPDSVPTTVAATLPLSGLTALRLIRAAGALVGRRVLVTGASGGVGHALTELAVGAGAEVVAVSRTADRGAVLSELGASVVASVEDAGDSFDIVFESVGGSTLIAALGAVVRHGRVLLFGQAGGDPATLDVFAHLASEATIELFSYWGADGGDQSTDLATLVRLVETGRLHPEIGRVTDWLSTPEVLVDLRERRIRGNAVLTIPAD